MQKETRDGPFLLCASYHHPHEPFWPPQEYWDLYEGADIEIPEFPGDLDDTYSMMDRNLNAYHGTRRFDLRDPDGLRRLRRAYYGLVTYMDRKVGELLDTLDACGLADNTVVVFASDHGDMLCEREMVQKRCFYDPSCRVPLLVRFPDRYKSGFVCSTPVSLLDLLPTFCRQAGVDPELPHDGDDLVPIIDGGDADRTVFAQAHEAIGMPCVMARQGDHKYNYIHGHAPQLFNLARDPGEWRNLAEDPECADVEERLGGAILERFDPGRMADENLASLYRRRMIGETMKQQGHTWAHFPKYDYRKGAVEQYRPRERGNR